MVNEGLFRKGKIKLNGVDQYRKLLTEVLCEFSLRNLISCHETLIYSLKSSSSRVQTVLFVHLKFVMTFNFDIWTQIPWSVSTSF